MAIVSLMASAIMSGFIGCAKPLGDVTQGAAEESFKNWMKKYAPKAVKQKSGIYIDFIERGVIGDLVIPKPDTSWLLMNYTMSTLDNIIFETRDSETTKLLATWAPTTHFTDDLIAYRSANYTSYSKICEGFRDAFKYLRIGDSARIYIPATLGYNSTVTDNDGYQGEGGEDVYAFRPIYIDVRLADIINSPRNWEMERVQSYVRKHWGFLSRDSTAWGLYMRVIGDNGLGNKITKDSVVRYYYAKRALDGHLMKTNVNGIIKKVDYQFYISWPTTFESFSGYKFEEAASDTTSNGIFAKAFLNMKTGQTVEVVATSRWCDGNAGVVGNIPQVLPYEPMKYKIRTMLWSDNAEKVDSLDLSLLY